MPDVPILCPANYARMYSRDDWRNEERYRRDWHPADGEYAHPERQDVIQKCTLSDPQRSVVQ
jgi:hypothetical protein